jgi:hypothetical protein
VYKALVEAHGIRTGSKCETIEEAKGLFKKVFPEVTFKDGLSAGVVWTAFNGPNRVGLIVRLAESRTSWRRTAERL